MNTVAHEHQARLIAVDEGSEGQRLDNFLAKCCKGVPKSHLYRLIRSGQVRVNGGRAKVDRRLDLNDQVRLPPLSLPAAAREVVSPMREREHARLGARLSLAYEDDSLLIVDKPAGVAVHGGSGVSSGVIEQLRAARPEARYLELVHRIDRETSGLLMVAKKRPSLRRLHEQMRLHKIRKTYLCAVLGKVPRRDQTIKAALRLQTMADGDRRVVVDAKEGKTAVSHMIGVHAQQDPVLGWISLVRVRIETGRTHQIRVHAAHAGYPLLGDRKYGNFDCNRMLARAGHNRMFLHAQQLQLRHPDTGAPLAVIAPLPSEFAQLMPQYSDD